MSLLALIRHAFECTNQQLYMHYILDVQEYVVFFFSFLINATLQIFKAFKTHVLRMIVKLQIATGVV